MMIFCTLYDSNYLDKGLMMYRSLLNTGCKFKMYTLAMDDKCREVLEAYDYENQIIIPVEKFCEEMGLTEVRQTRKRGEFYWTCTSYLIDYVLTKYGEQICTYVDSDLCFYSNPQCLIDEMGDKTVQIVPHRYNKTVFGKLSCLGSGTYCVQFNTFKNTKDALELLHWWEDRCLEDCSNISLKKNGVFGDQGYLEHWGEKENVEILQNLGGGVAPWNLAQYALATLASASSSIKDNNVILKEKSTGKEFKLIFYHYHNLIYYNAYEANASVHEVWNADVELVKFLYSDYLVRVNEIKEELRERFGVYPLLTSHPGLNTTPQRCFLEKLRAIMSDRLFLFRLYSIIVFRINKSKYKNINTVSLCHRENA